MRILHPNGQHYSCSWDARSETHCIDHVNTLEERLSDIVTRWSKWKFSLKTIWLPEWRLVNMKIILLIKQKGWTDHKMTWFCEQFHVLFDWWNSFVSICIFFVLLMIPLCEKLHLFVLLIKWKVRTDAIFGRFHVDFSLLKWFCEKFHDFVLLIKWICEKFHDFVSLIKWICEKFHFLFH